MKKLIFLLIATFSLVHDSSAQYDDGMAPMGRPRGGRYSTPWRFGVYLAPNMSWMKATNTKSNDGVHRVMNDGSKVGFVWGLMADYQFSENYSIETGASVNSTGGIISTSIVPTQIPATGAYINTTTFDYSLQYLEVPFNLKLRTYDIGGGVQLFGQIGLSAGINLSKKATYTVNYIDDNDNPVTLTGDDERIQGNLTIAPILLSLNVGGGLEYPVGERLNLYFGLFFNNGFVPDVTNPAGYSFDFTNAAIEPTFRDGNTRLNNFSLRLGLFF